MNYQKSICLSVALAVPQIAHAQASESDPIIVTAARSETRLSQVGQSVSVISAQDLKLLQTVSLVDALRIVPGVSFTRNGGIGTSASVTIRGADGDQTVALIDGVKLNDPSSSGSGFDFGRLLAGNISRVEVVRGSQSVLWGSQAIGGVINIITREPTGKTVLNANAEYGWRDTAQVTANLSGKIGPVSASVGGGYFTSDSISTFNEARGASEHDGFENFGANAKVNIPLSDQVSVDLRGWYSNSIVGIDGFAPPNFDFGDTDEAAKFVELVGYAGVNLAVFGGRLRNRLAFAYTNTARDNFDMSSGARVETFVADGENRRFEYQGNVDVAADTVLVFGAESETSSFKASSYGGPVAVAEATINSVYAQLGTTVFGALTLTGGIRRDDHDVFGGKTTAAANAVFSPNDGATTIRASYGEGFKTPSLFQLFSDFGNINLMPETSKSYDASISQTLLGGALTAGLTWFNRDTANQINFISCETPLTGICIDRPFGTYDNIARTRANGIEFGLSLKPVSSLTVEANYSWINARDRATRLPLPRRPRHSVNTRIDKMWACGLATGVSIKHVGASFDNASNTRRIPGYVLVDLRASFALSPQFSLYGRIENLFDEQYETIFSYGTPRRAAYGGIRMSF